MTILIVEDESRIAGRIERMTKSYFGPLAKITVTDHVAAAISYLKTNTVDLVLLDLNLNGQDGFEVLQTVTTGSYHTIIISAYTDKAITAFHYGVIDFVPKPFDEDRLHQAFARLTQKYSSRETYVNYLGVRKAGTTHFINIGQLLYIKGAGIYSELHLVDGGTALSDKSLDKLEQLLPPSFLRIHRSYIVPFKNCVQLSAASGSRYGLVLANGVLLPVGRSRLQALKARFVA